MSRSTALLRRAKTHADNDRSMDRLKKAAELASQKARGEVPAAAPENEGPEIERNVVIDNKLLVAFWSCCQLER